MSMSRHLQGQMLQQESNIDTGRAVSFKLRFGEGSSSRNSLCSCMCAGRADDHVRIFMGFHSKMPPNVRGLSLTKQCLWFLLPLHPGSLFWFTCEFTRKTTNNFKLSSVYRQAETLREDFFPDSISYLSLNSPPSVFSRLSCPSWSFKDQF